MQTNTRDVIAAFLEPKYPHHFHLFNLTEEEYDPMIFDNAVLGVCCV